MPKYVYCAECGVRLELTLKATPQLSEKIMTLVPPHQCAEGAKELSELGITPDPVPTFVGGKFQQNLDDLTKPKVEADLNLMDRRPKEQIKDSIAPSSVIDMLVKKKDLGDDPRGV